MYVTFIQYFSFTGCRLEETRRKSSIPSMSFARHTVTSDPPDSPDGPGSALQSSSHSVDRPPSRGLGVDWSASRFQSVAIRATLSKFGTLDQWARDRKYIITKGDPRRATHTGMNLTKLAVPLDAQDVCMALLARDVLHSRALFFCEIIDPNCFYMFFDLDIPVSMSAAQAEELGLTHRVRSAGEASTKSLRKWYSFAEAYLREAQRAMASFMLEDQPLLTGDDSIREERESGYSLTEDKDAHDGASVHHPQGNGDRHLLRGFATLPDFNSETKECQFGVHGVWRVAVNLRTALYIACLFRAILRYTRPPGPLGAWKDPHAYDKQVDMGCYRDNAGGGLRLPWCWKAKECPGCTKAGTKGHGHGHGRSGAPSGPTGSTSLSDLAMARGGTLVSCQICQDKRFVPVGKPYQPLWAITSSGQVDHDESALMCESQMHALRVGHVRSGIDTQLTTLRLPAGAPVPEQLEALGLAPIPVPSSHGTVNGRKRGRDVDCDDDKADSKQQEDDPDMGGDSDDDQQNHPAMLQCAEDGNVDSDGAAGAGGAIRPVVKKGGKSKHITGPLAPHTDEAKALRQMANKKVDIPAAHPLFAMAQEEARSFHPCYSRVLLHAMKTNKRHTYFLLFLDDVGNRHCLNKGGDHRRSTVYFYINNQGDMVQRCSNKSPKIRQGGKLACCNYASPPRKVGDLLAKALYFNEQKETKTLDEFLREDALLRKYQAISDRDLMHKRQRMEDDCDREYDHDGWPQNREKHEIAQSDHPVEQVANRGQKQQALLLWNLAQLV